MVYYKLVKAKINILGFAKIIINIVIRHHGLPNSIFSDQELLFTSKFWLLLYYFLGIKQRLLTTFHPQTNGQTERQNSIMEAYLQVFINFEQNN